VSKSHWHRDLFEGSSAKFAIASTVVILIGGIAEIAPMYAVGDAAPPMEPYTPLEQAGRDIYVREGCYTCHSQMVRPLEHETLRYGPAAEAWEYTYDRPFQLGSRRIGPDLQRVGGKYPDAWHWNHLLDPRSTSPGSVMPTYGWLLADEVDPADVTASIGALATLGHPYADTSEAGVTRLLDEQAAGIVTNLAGAKIDANPRSEAVAMIAYLQRLGSDLKKQTAEVTP
jgi:cytochrome c oxidase cbb3-type subunit I/II